MERLPLGRAVQRGRHDQRDRLGRPEAPRAAERLAEAHHPRECRTLEVHGPALGRVHHDPSVRIGLSRHVERPLRELLGMRVTGNGQGLPCTVPPERHADRAVSVHDRRRPHLARVERCPARLVVEPAQHLDRTGREVLPPATVLHVRAPHAGAVGVRDERPRRCHHRPAVPELGERLLEVARETAGVAGFGDRTGEQGQRFLLADGHQVPERPQIRQQLGELVTPHPERASVGQLHRHGLAATVHVHVRGPLGPRRELRVHPPCSHGPVDLSEAAHALRQDPRRALVRKRQLLQSEPLVAADLEGHQLRPAVRAADRGDSHFARAERGRVPASRLSVDQPVRDHLGFGERSPGTTAVHDELTTTARPVRPQVHVDRRRRHELLPALVRQRSLEVRSRATDT